MLILFQGSLPVELTYFNAQKNSANHRIKRVDTIRNQQHYFEVQRSDDAQAREVLTEILSKITSTSIQDYQYIDINPEAGDNYYRLKQVDIHGSFEYSEIETVNLAAAGKRI